MAKGIKAIAKCAPFIKKAIKDTEERILMELGVIHGEDAKRFRMYERYVATGELPKDCTPEQEQELYKWNQKRLKFLGECTKLYLGMKYKGGN